jgi:DNA primase
MTLTPAFLDELRARTTLSALIGRSVKITRAGREYKACCPFHNEKTPSFTINDEKGFYHCFGCGAHGDAIRWMTEHNGLPFIDAVKELAQAAGLDMPEDDPRAAQRAERARGLHEVMADAAKFYSEQLRGIAGAEARALLQRRGINANTASAFGMGYAPDSRTKLREALKSYGDAMLVEAGLLIQVDGKEPYDRFRGRLMIPIKDARGRVIGFGGRIIGEGEPKYLNSPETPLFDKGRTLYNLDRAAVASRKAGRVIVVEGYMDVIALAQAGFHEAVAPLGTALTEHQLERLWRMTNTPVLALDGDAAGQKAAIRAAHRSLPLLQPGRSLAFAILPTGMDPDDLIAASGKEAFESIVNNTEPLDTLLWKSELAGLTHSPGPDERAALEARLRDIAGKISHPGLAREYTRSLIDRFYAAFGPKNRRFEVVGESIVAALRRPGRGLVYAFHRAVLLGLMRHTSVLRSHYELVQDLPITDRYLTRWKDHLVDLSFRSDLDEDVVEEALSHTDISPIEKRDLSRDLGYSFFHRGSDRIAAEADLVQVMLTLIEEAEARKAAELAHARFAAELNEEAFERQQVTRDAAAAALHRLQKWIDLAEAA